ncbi:histidine phosphatase superfamily, partial [Paraphysoderma sedebokerense]
MLPLETALNADKVLQGSGVDPPLNAKGLKQAQCLSQRLKNVEVDWIVSSELERAVQTAQEVLKYHPNVPFTKYAALAEINWGIYEGKVSPDLSTIFDAWKAGNFAAKPPKGESPLECESRVIPCLLSIVHKANTLNNKKQKTVVVICHGRLLRIILASLLHQSLYFMSAFTHQNTGVNVLDFVID